MNKIKNKALALFSIVALVAFAFTTKAVTLPLVPANYDDSLASGISASATSLTLVNGTDRSGNSLSGFACFTIDEGSPSLEYVCGTASGTAVTGLTRGLDAQNPNATSTGSVHRRGANVKITDYPLSGFLKRILNGVDSLTSILKYDFSTYTQFTDDRDIVNKAYVDGQTAGTVHWTLSGINIYNANAGNVGIGSSTPGYKLTVLGDAYTSGSSTTAGNLSVSGNSATTGSSTVAGNLTVSGNSTLGTSTNSGTATFNNVIVNGTITGSGLSKFGGTGADGALSIGSGTTTLDIATTTVFTKNYSSISITGTGALAFSNPHASGTVVILKSQGACTLTSSNALMINLKGIGAAGGAANGAASGTQAFGILDDAPHFGGNTSAGVGTQYTNRNFYTYASTTPDIVWRKGIFIVPGSGGGSGKSAGGGTVAGAGGRGGGALLMECAGDLNFTGTINASGENGNVGTGAGGYSSGGGGGGAAGMVVILYNGNATSTGIITTAGGAGGASQPDGGSNMGYTAGMPGAGSIGGAGGAGGAAGGGAGSNAGGPGAGGGGAGGDDLGGAGGSGGASYGGIVRKNTEF